MTGAGGNPVVRCNACGWINTGLLTGCLHCGAPLATQQAASVAAPAPAPAATGYRTTHFAPHEGMQTWPAPDPQSPPGPRLDPRLEVMLAEARPDGWARIVCSNGWSAWVDGRLLTPTHQ